MRNLEATRSAFIDQSHMLEGIMAEVADLGQDTRLEGPRPADLGDDVVWIDAETVRSIHQDERLPVFG